MKIFVIVATTIWAIGICLTPFLKSIPPDDLPIYIGLTCIALIPLFLGSQRYRIFGAIALAVSIYLAVHEYSAGQTSRLDGHSQKNAMQPSVSDSPLNTPPKP
jgi:hypothetical protein